MPYLPPYRYTTFYKNPTTTDDPPTSNETNKKINKLEHDETEAKLHYRERERGKVALVKLYAIVN